MRRVPLGNWSQTPSIWTLSIWTGVAVSVLIRKKKFGRREGGKGRRGSGGGLKGASPLFGSRRGHDFAAGIAGRGDGGDGFGFDELLGSVFRGHRRRHGLRRARGKFLRELGQETLGRPRT